MSEQFDVVIIGAGPAGLAAGAALAEGNRKIAIYEAGSSLSGRQRELPESTIQGVGGAGLYSDGKFSFYPSASALWQLGDAECLRQSYSWLKSLLAEDGVTIPPFRDPLIEPVEKVKQNGQKHYPSFYIPFEKRKALISKLEQKTQGNTHTLSRVLRIDQRVNSLLLHVDTPAGVVMVTSKTVIFAGGRFGPSILRYLAPSLPTVFRRIELGIRVEQPADDFIFKDNKATDVKLIKPGKEGSEEWRTFCTCRNGEVIETSWNGLRSFSGRADGDKTSLSNVGINLRFTSNPKDSALLLEIHNALSGNMAPFEINGEEFCSLNKAFFGPQLDAKFRQRLLELLPKDSLSKVRIYGPCIEGLGTYPDVNEVLKVNSSDVWIAGDATGTFRGLTAALLLSIA